MSSHISGWTFLKGLFPSIWAKRKNTLKGKKKNNKPISTHRGYRAHPLEFTSSTPTPKPLCKKKLFWRCLVLCNGHRITFVVTELDANVRGYTFTNILTAPFWLGQASGNQHSCSSLTSQWQWRVKMCVALAVCCQRKPLQAACLWKFFLFKSCFF